MGHCPRLPGLVGIAHSTYLEVCVGGLRLYSRDFQSPGIFTAIAKRWYVKGAIACTIDSNTTQSTFAIDSGRDFRTLSDRACYLPKSLW